MLAKVLLRRIPKKTDQKLQQRIMKIWTSVMIEKHAAEICIPMKSVNELQGKLGSSADVPCT